MPVVSHIAFICDGNGRWAKDKGLPRTAGHVAGLKKTQKVVDWCIDRGIPNVSAFLWSTENWKRDSQEVKGIMNAVVKYGPAFAERMHRRGIRLVHAGIREGIADPVLSVIDYGIDLTKHNSNARLCLAFNYGGKADILHAVNEALVASEGRPITVEEVTRHLMSHPMPDIDLLVRTGNEQRISNFMLWQAAFATLHISPTYWPDFSERELDRILEEYKRHCPASKLVHAAPLAL